MAIASKPPPSAATLPKPRLPASSWALRALVLVGIVFLLQAAKPLLLPVLIAVVLTFVLATPMRAFAIEAAATVILLYFLLASEHWLVSRTVEAVQRRRTRALVLGGIRQAQREVGLYLGTMSLINLVLGTLTGLAVGWIGLPNPALWGAVTGVMNFVPYLGPAVVTGMLLLAGSMSF